MIYRLWGLSNKMNWIYFCYKSCNPVQEQGFKNILGKLNKKLVGKGTGTRREGLYIRSPARLYKEATPTFPFICKSVDISKKSYDVTRLGLELHFDVKRTVETADHNGRR